MEHQYYKLDNGEFVSKSKVDDALKLIRRITASGCVLVTITDDEVIHKGNKVEATLAFYRKYDCSLLEAKSAIEFLRGENL